MVSICGICNVACVNDESDPVVKCSGGCEKSFHARCVRGELESKKTTRSYKDWRCKECRKAPSTQSSSQSTVSTAVIKDFLVRVLEDFKKEFFSELRAFKSEMADLSKAVQFVSDKLDESTKLWKVVKEELALVKKENEDLKLKNTAISGEVHSLSNRVRSLEQYSRRNNLEISGIPVTNNEDVVCLVGDVGLALGVKIDQDEVTAAHRVPSYRKDRPPPIILQFLRRSSRDAWLSKYRDRKGSPLQANKINTAFPQSNVYVNEHLSPENKIFLAKLKSKAKEVGYEHAWCREGNFFVRKRQGERYVRILSVADLDRLK